MKLNNPMLRKMQLNNPLLRKMQLNNPMLKKNCPRGVMVNAMDYGIVVREFVLQSRYYVTFTFGQIPLEKV